MDFNQTKIGSQPTTMGISPTRKGDSNKKIVAKADENIHTRCLSWAFGDIPKSVLLVRCPLLLLNSIHSRQLGWLNAKPYHDHVFVDPLATNFAQ
jgi:hypothetical protein